ncbi:uncharacterized protein LOC111071636 [Drosophila obscura]|uniref:uncharacterized protein LOC111071636 n=1 Tax=Drosophila obscura TaxID=7282 RepID=UPI001BB2A2D4|nr:uncharacterized protein LOC111071636 [Drosophila obscura]
MKHFLAVLGLLLALNCAPAFAADSGLCEKLFKSASDFCEKDLLFTGLAAQRLKRASSFLRSRFKAANRKSARSHSLGFSASPAKTLARNLLSRQMH